jgi:large subunit ribosomal protein L1
VPELQSWASHITTAERLIQPAVDQQSNSGMGSALNRAARFERWETRKQMRKISKNLKKARALVEPRPYVLADAVPLLQKAKYAKFDETVDLTMRLGVDPKHADQMVRGTVVLPHGLGKTKIVAVIASGEKIKDAQAAGADFFGGEELVEKIQKENWTAFDALIATPDMMKSVGRLGKVLGPKGLMPNPKTGTVTTDVVSALKEIKAGKVEFRTDKTALVHVPVGKLSFDPQKLIDNANTVISSVVKAKPSAAKGKYIKGVTLSSTMGPGIQLDFAAAEAAGKAS